MDVLSIEFLTALLSIIFIDLVLAGDNALLIGLVAKNLPHHHQKRIIVLGAIGAIGVRIILTLVAVKLLEINGLLLVGGILLIYISYKLLLTEEELDVHPGKRTFWGAIGTILLADILMGMDNIIAVAGAANGNMLLVAIGLIISIPIVIWGSTMVTRLMEKYPFIIVMGAAILAWTAAKMIVKDEYVAHFFQTKTAMYTFEAIVVTVIISIGLTVKVYVQRKNKKDEVAS
ncbi:MULTISPECIES: TerC family protein [Lysinibacillus]|uniref:TerC family protein n=1 Tax=Lysinibacillus antri TaxID=2498145 RepID=A0A432LJ00_9BACI|nr:MULTISPECIES: TerC family protein [Lysinibacillus]RUL57094.1 TerC family protein [Lysinibacillus antri]TSI03272.1 TerC family protein [Lysinibacillus sp. BW-2-10]